MALRAAAKTEPNCRVVGHSGMFSRQGDLQNFLDAVMHLFLNRGLGKMKDQILISALLSVVPRRPARRPGENKIEGLEKLTLEGDGVVGVYCFYVSEIQGFWWARCSARVHGPLLVAMISS